MKAMRSWCARVQFKGHEPFLIGNVELPVRARPHEIEAAIEELLSRHTPSPPAILALLPGAIVFAADGEEIALSQDFRARHAR